MSVRDGKKTSATTATGPSMGASGPVDAGESTVVWPSESRQADPIIQRPAAAVTADPPARCGTAFSEAETLVRANSDRVRNSIAKPPLDNRATQYGEGSSEAPLRSIFPEYNPNLPLSQQNYYPPQSSPTHPAGIPAGAISRRLYSPTSEERPENNEDTTSPLRSPMSANSSRTHQQTATRKWPPPRVNVKPSTPEPSTTEQLRNFWKVANGWKAPASEGRVYTFMVSGERDTPIYTLSSKTSQPFYRLKLDPTSASAYVSLSRFDPSKPYKPPVPPKDGGSGSPRGGSSESVGGGEQAAKGWQEVLSTTLEEAARHHAPHDGLVALLYPLPAAKLAVDSRYTNPAAFATAERECARLVWDDDSGNHFLVHPALAMPFCVTVERNPAWSRTEYTLEHVESPQHLARLTRDGTGTGWLEVDTGIAAKIDAVYLVDVAVAALMLVAHADGEFTRVEVFDPPPPSLRGESRQQQQQGGPGQQQDGRISRISRMSPRANSGDKKDRKAGKTRMEELELDLESQTSDLKKHSKRRSKDEDKMPGCARAIISLLSFIFKCFIWCATVLFKALTGCISLFARCITSEKL
ncbi:putative acetylserotonin methytransferase-like protein [Diaporthe ampelina]|uniref:Putative acetylserotonin methytransferase-like protein n=1 Tax=Diaporthe ampelina TaxID=1214573 RepID=A0A0G2H4U7_9PEZI|nr:putative acetylserotonin methytransferase-like protein [Diaporthe ampelina]